MGKLTIFGAKSIALGVCMAVKELYPDCQVEGFVVTDKSGNPDTLCGLPVAEAATYADKNTPVLLAIPVNIQEGVRSGLNEMGYRNIIGLDSEKEAELMRRYYKKKGDFLPLKQNPAQVYIARSHKDHPLKEAYDMPQWACSIQVGAALCNQRLSDLSDATGENISHKNANYCELTALYWIWKNRLLTADDTQYYGLFQYRRVLDISKEDIEELAKDKVDVVLPYPMACEPSILEHHARYVKESDWNAMLQALSQIYPEYDEKAQEVLRQQYMYNYNIILAKKEVLKDYCEWLFAILEKTEELSVPKGYERADRYIGYLGENLLTIYFMCNKKKLKIRHTGRIMLV